MTMKFEEWNIIIKTIILFTIVTFIASIYGTISTIYNISTYIVNWFQTILAATKIKSYEQDCENWIYDGSKIKWCNFIWYFNGKWQITWNITDRKYIDPEYRMLKLFEDYAPIDIISVITNQEPNIRNLLYKKVSDKIFLSKENISFLTWSKNYFNVYDDNYNLQFFSLVTTKNKNNIEEKKILFADWLFRCNYYIEHDSYSCSASIIKEYKIYCLNNRQIITSIFDDCE